MPVQGDYEAVAKHTRSARAHSSTCSVKKPRCPLMTELAKELPFPQRALVAGVAAEISEPIAVTQEIASEVGPATSERAVVIVT